jgi:hypothetical protein
MPYDIKKIKGGYIVCKKYGNKKCMPGKSKSHKIAQKRIIAANLNESFNQTVNRILKTFI